MSSIIRSSTKHNMGIIKLFKSVHGSNSTWPDSSAMHITRAAFELHLDFHIHFIFRVRIKVAHQFGIDRNYRLITAYLLLRVNLDKIMHAR